EVEARQDISFDGISRLNDQFSKIIVADPAVAAVVSFAGATGGNSSENTARMFIQLKPFGERPPIQQVMARLRPPVAGAVPIYADRHGFERAQSLGADPARQDAGDEYPDRRRHRSADRFA